MTVALRLADLVPHAAERAADAEAVRSGDGALTYGQLEEATAQVAAALASVGVRRGDRVGVYLHKSVAAFTAVHGVLRSGAAYVPIDPYAPVHAVATIVEDCGIEVLVSDDRMVAQLRALAAAAPALRTAIGVEQAVDGLTVVPPAEVAAAGPFVPPAVLSEDLAYVMYTSGSTGRPKGLMHTHRSGLRYAQLATSVYGVGADDRLANSAPFHFDISTFELFAGPLAGASALIIPEPYLKVPASLSRLVADDRSTFWYSVPFLLGELLARGALDDRDLGSLRWVLFGGEVADPELIARLMVHMPNARFSNSYGPAEVNQCTYHHVDQPPRRGEPIPIGRPWHDAEVQVVDDDREAVPPGDVGELLVRTSTMMDGYWGRPDLDRSAFVLTPLPGGRHARWFATGDLVRRRPDGELEFVGRRDHQVKVRGNRVELEAVEAVLAGVPGVAHAVAAVVEVGDSTALVAGVTADGDVPLDTAAVLREVAALLPPYAVPFRLVVLDEVPLTATGKVDRRAVRQALRERAVEGPARERTIEHGARERTIEHGARERTIEQGALL